MKQTTFYIGADMTGEIDQKKITELISEHFTGGTIIPATGIWEGQTENSVMVIVGHDVSDGYLQRFCLLLCDELKQDAVGLSDGQSFRLVTIDDSPERYADSTDPDKSS